MPIPLYLSFTILKIAIFLFWHDLCFIKLQVNKTDKTLEKTLNRKRGENAMLTDQKITNEQVAAFDSNVEVSDLAIGNSRFGIGIIMAMAGFVGAWGILCLLNGIAQSQTIQELGHGIFTAFTGI